MRIVGFCLFAGFTLATAILVAAEPPESDLLAALEKRLKATNEKVGPCVACVVVSRSDKYPPHRSGEQPGNADDHQGKLGGFDKDAFVKAYPKLQKLAVSLDLSDPNNITDHGFACGVVIDPAGLILTPYHVVEGATKIYVHLPGQSGSYADIHAADSRSDLAVLKLITPPQGLTAIKFGEVRLQPQHGKPATITRGKLTILVASSSGPDAALNKPTAAMGSVTNLHIPNPNPDKNEIISDSYYTYAPLIAHDAKLNMGIDGAALLDLDGNLIGLTTSTAILTGERGASYAFPADEYFRNIVEVLRRGEEVEYGYLGVRGPIKDQRGLRFQSVMLHSPASRAGMDEHDLLTHVNGYPTSTYPELLLRVGSALAGTKVTLTLVASGRNRDVEVTLGKFAHKQPFIASVRPEPVFGLRVDYSSVLAQKDNAHAPVFGVCVRDIAAKSPAAMKLGERPERWFITRVNGTPVRTPAEFYKAAKGEKTIKLTLLDPTESKSAEREVTLP
jgi:serine protease Do